MDDVRECGNGHIQYRCQGVNHPIGQWSACRDDKCRFEVSGCKQIEDDCRAANMTFPSEGRVFYDCKGVDYVNRIAGKCVHKG